MLRGNARILSDNTEIIADEIELYGAEFRFASSRGNVVVTDKDKGIRLSAPNVFFDRKLRISRVNGSAYLEDQKNELIVRGGFLENRESEDVILIQIGVRIIKEDMIARGDMARYDRKKQILELTGLPSVVYKGDEFKARRITINIETNEILLDGQVSGTYIPAESEETNETPPSEPPPAETPASPAAVIPEPETAPEAENDNK